MSKNETAKSIVREIRRKTRKKYTAEEKIRIVLEAFVVKKVFLPYGAMMAFSPIYYKWSKEFLGAGNER